MEKNLNYQCRLFSFNCSKEHILMLLFTPNLFKEINGDTDRDELKSLLSSFIFYVFKIRFPNRCVEAK